MKYSVGDKVKFLNEVGGGIISKIVNSGIVTVMDDDGFEIPVRMAEIILVERGEYKEPPSVQPVKDEPPVQKNIVKPEKPADNADIRAEDTDQEVIDSDDYEILLAFVPKDGSNPTDCALDVYFINDSSFYCTYAVSYHTGADRLRLLKQSTIEPDTKEYVYSIEKADFTSKLNLQVVSFLYKYREYKNYPPEQVIVELNPVKFSKKSSFVENDFFDENAYILKLAVNSIPDMEIHIDSAELEKAMQQKDAALPPAEPAPKAKPEAEEIDLHIEELVEDIRGLDSGQILEIQKARFITAMEFGFVSKTKKMVFIHGVGNGKLKQEIRRLLDTQYAGLVRYHDASFREYGLGATMVILK
ncbi:MAG: DUF2027 domain-containing protein [Prevotellaceae bacterium]|jgi:hypothetical protein|nr:DUF2027 domain-containing protein [Prevotellaceae bacterium]